MSALPLTATHLAEARSVIGLNAPLTHPACRAWYLSPSPKAGIALWFLAPPGALPLLGPVTASRPLPLHPTFELALACVADARALGYDHGQVELTSPALFRFLTDQFRLDLKASGWNPSVTNTASARTPTRWLLTIPLAQAAALLSDYLSRTLPP